MDSCVNRSVYMCSVQVISPMDDANEDQGSLTPVFSPCSVPQAVPSPPDSSGSSNNNNNNSPLVAEEDNSSVLSAGHFTSIC